MNNSIWVFLLSFIMHGVFGADEIEVIKVTEKDPVTLQTGLTETKSSDQIYWLYGPDKLIIAQISNGISQIFDGRSNGIFKDKLELDTQTGSLTITDIQIKNSGVYEADIRSTPRKFSVKVYAHLPTPEIVSPTCVQKLASFSSPKCVFTCSVQTSEQTSLTWYKGSSSVSSKISDICSTLSLHLEVDYKDENSYSCVVKNDISNQTTLLDINEKCQICADSELSSGAVIAIVVLVLVIAVVAGLGFSLYKQKIAKLLKQAEGNFYLTAEGGDVTIKIETKLHLGDVVQWRFKNESSLIAEIKDGKISTYDGPDGIFRGRLKLDETGSLTIRDIRPEHTRDYTIEINKISRGKTTKKIFIVSFKSRKILVQEGGHVTLNPDTEIQRGDEIQWLFGDQDQVIVRMTGETRKIEYPDERFRDRLELDKKTGSLTIKNIRAEHIGDFKVKISSSSRGNRIKKFSLFFPDSDGTQLMRSAPEASRLLHEDGQSAGKANEKSSPV